MPENPRAFPATVDEKGVRALRILQGQRETGIKSLTVSLSATYISLVLTWSDLSAGAKACALRGASLPSPFRAAVGSIVLESGQV